MAKKKKNYNMMALSVALQMSWEGGDPVPVLLYGVPGTAKTQVVQQLAKACADELKRRGWADDYPCDLNVLPQTMPETIEGIPAPDLEAKALERYPLIGIRKLINAGWGVWVGDEWTSCPQATGAAAMTLIQDGRAGDVTLSKKVARVLCANPPDCAAAGRDPSWPEINRVCVLDWELPLHDFLDYLAGGPGLLAHMVWLPEGWEERHKATAATLVRSYLERNPKHCNTLSSKVSTDEQEGEPWASQRQWVNFMRLTAAAFSLGEAPSSSLVNIFANGCLGTGVAKSLMTFLREFDLPSPEDVLEAAMKKDATVDTIAKAIPDHVWRRPDKIKLMLESVAIFAQQAPDEHRGKFWQAAFKVIEPVLDAKPDNAMSAAKLLIDRKPAGVTVPKVAVKLFKAREAAGMSKSRRKSTR